MFLKNVKHFFFKSNSITKKLIFLYSLSSSIALIIIMFIIYFAEYKIITVSGAQFMIDEAVTIRDLIKEYPDNLSYLNKEINGVTSTMETYNKISYYYYIRLYDNNEKLIKSTPESPPDLKHSIFPKLRPNQAYSKFINWTSSSGRKFLLFSAPVEYKKGKVTKYIDMAFEISYPYFLMKEYLSWFLLTLFLCFLFIAYVARWLTKKGLKQLYASAREITKIKASELDNPINIQKWPEELVVFGSAFNELLNRVNSVFKRLSESTAELAHELRTPINNLIVQTEVTLLKKRETDEYCELLSNNIQNYHRLTSVINSVLLLAKYENPSTIINKQPIQLDVEIKRICQNYQIIAEQRGISIKASGSGLINADKVLLERALTNILINAINYNNPNGQINIEIKRRASFTSVTFSDTGIGIPKEELNNLNQSGYVDDKLDKNQINIPKKNEYSFGIGLRLTDSIMRLHKGRLHIDSELGKWTSVTLEFFN